MKLILSLSHLRHNSGGQNHFQGECPFCPLLEQSLDHDRVIGHISCNRVSIVFLFSTPHATMNFYIMVVVYTYVGLLHLFNILYSTYNYTVFCTKFHVCFGMLSRKLIYSE